MLKIRLTRVGMKKQPSYRVVVADADAKRDGRIVERIGHYNPLTDPAEYRIDEDRALYWLSVGAQPTDAVRRLLEKQGTYDRLARLRQGEEREVLVSEYLGRAADETSRPAPAAVASAVATAAATVAESVTGAAEAVAEAVSDAVADVAAEVSERIEAVIGAEEEE